MIDPIPIPRDNIDEEEFGEEEEPLRRGIIESDAEDDNTGERLQEEDR